MSAFPSLVLWSAARLLRSPVTWLVLAGLGGAWGLTLFLSPIGLTSANLGAEAVIYEFAFLGALAGCALVLSPLEELSWLLQRTSASRRLALTLPLFAWWSLAGLTIAAVLPALIVDPATVLTLRFGWAALGGALHLAALGLLAHAWPLPPGLRPLVLTLAVWLVPAVLVGAPAAVAAPADLLDVARHWRPAPPGDTLAPWRGASAVAALLIVSCGLLPTARDADARRAAPSRRPEGPR